MKDCAKGVFDGWSLTPEFYALPVDGIDLVINIAIIKAIINLLKTRLI